MNRLCLFVLALAGCQTAPSSPVVSSAALVPLASCDQAIEFVRQVAIERMNQQIDAQLARFESGGTCYQYRYGGGEEDFNASAGPSAPTTSGTTGGTTGSGGTRATSASGTNNQVAGVDEADFVKNDGKYIYLAQNGVLRIVDAYPGSTAREVSRTPLDGAPKKMFVVGDRALVYLSVPRSDGSRASWGGGRECTYGYDCQFTGDGTATRLVLFDVSDRTSPVKLREILLSGALLAARRIDTATHTVVSDNLQPFPELRYWPKEDLCDYQALPEPLAFVFGQRGNLPPPDAVAKAIAAFEALRESNRQIILGKDLSGLLPRLADSAFAAPPVGDTLCNGLYRAQLLDGASFTTVVSLEMAGVSPATTASIVSSPGAVYASERALYLAVPSEQDGSHNWYAGWSSEKQLSSIHKFAISAAPGDTAYLASGLVRGRVLNQFAMDERDGHLRIATTSGRVPDPNVESQLTVLAAAGGALITVGEVTHIAPGEDIRSVRFDGARAFVVTFKKTDPLFVLDVGTPSAPRKLGELKIPGFSTYMHMLDDNHLLSIGYDADDHGSFAYFDGVLLQIFDVSDPENPALAHRHVIGTRGSSSEALTNHLAFNYFAPLKMLAVPMTVCDGGDDGRYADRLTFSGLMLFDIDPTSGIREHGRVAHATDVDFSATSYRNSPYACSNWWTNASSDVKRSIFMDRFVYSISNEVMKVQSIDALGTDLASLALRP
jgi:hypothetical protein